MQVFFFYESFFIIVSDILKKKVCFIQSDYFACHLNDSFKYKLYRQFYGFFFLDRGSLAWKISRYGNCSLRQQLRRRERYVIRNVVELEDPIKRSRWRSWMIYEWYSRRAIIIGFRRSLVLSFLHRETPEMKGTKPSFSRISSQISTIYIFL